MVRKVMKNKWRIQSNMLMFIRAGYSARSSLAYEKITEQTFYRWLREDSVFQTQYAKARHRQDIFYQKKIDKLSGKFPSKKRVKEIDAIKWQHGRMKAKKYKVI